jgi:tetratricopeptide (TPR) repeat protein
MIYLTMRPEPQPDQARDAYRRLLELRPNDVMALNNMACLLAETISPPQPGEAIQYSQRAYDLMTTAGGRDPLILDTHGWVLALVGRTDEGIDLLRQAVAAKPFAEGYYHLGEAYLKASFPEEALRNLELARQEMKTAEDAKRAVDVVLKGKVEDATRRAKDAIGAKASARSSRKWRRRPRLRRGGRATLRGCADAAGPAALKLAGSGRIVRPGGA